VNNLQSILKRAYLLTGKPGVGKTSLIKEFIPLLVGRAGGFYTEEVREHGSRTGFIIRTLDGVTGTLASVRQAGPLRVGRYGVDVKSLDMVGVAAIRAALQTRDVIIIDEIGKMELLSENFRKVMLEALESGRKVLGTILLAHHRHADYIKRRPDVEILELTVHNRDQVKNRILAWLFNMM
jgi:nucleoside-triphosphatase